MAIFTWQKVDEAIISLLTENRIMEVEIAGRRVGLLKRKDGIFAFTAACPHAGAPLCEGWLDPQGRIVCPDHKYRFDPVNGRNTTGEGYKLFTYPLEVKDGELYIGFVT